MAVYLGDSGVISARAGSKARPCAYPLEMVGSDGFG